MSFKSPAYSLKSIYLLRFIIFFCCCSPLLHGAKPDSLSPARKNYFLQLYFTIDYINANIDRSLANDIDVSTSGHGFLLGNNFRVYHYLSIRIDIGAASFKDLDPFSQMTTDGEKESQVGMFVANIQLGLNSPLFWLNRRISVAGSMYYGSTYLDMERNIPDCSNCRQYDIFTYGRSSLDFDFQLYFYERYFYRLYVGFGMKTFPDYNSRDLNLYKLELGFMLYKYSP